MKNHLHHLDVPTFPICAFRSLCGRLLSLEGDKGYAHESPDYAAMS